LGGSVGFQADKLDEYFGDVAMRDVGYVASEGSITVSYTDNTPYGILALHNNYYEFIPVDECIDKDAQPLQCHEIEDGRQYRIFLTNINGLYRYDIHDIVEVRGFYNSTPVIAFVRKGDDMVNITGEKLHLNHFLEVFNRLKNDHSFKTNHIRIVPDYESLRYEIFMNIETDVTANYLRDTIIPLVDKYLSETNIEYHGKRKSGRLHLPSIHVMDNLWVDAVREQFLKHGRRDIQYKWRTILIEATEIDITHIKYTITI
ncbi:MAG: GH3 auxin-responsive promoter family protein, partial [Kiritimatiellae bacterium]|nr:GH3 auxin-responsive promoter family protein [Kiritimatiellia bacterium]